MIHRTKKYKNWKNMNIQLASGIEDFHKLKYGKYKGKTAGEIKDTDPEYYQWLKSLKKSES